ncbi:MBL fold metallo-hydrolase [Planctomycetaceae bacterium]|jgi:glyoxylase-like metal-dependent hydrolase (beta-lactamase superfamily II)|nr:MBL fold metallo-hydrolase [Planctomycetaceae bacterium]MDB4786697.1 MBL fold metallo-hydrolase [Planctomycetaceae bacterium]
MLFRRIVGLLTVCILSMGILAMANAFVVAEEIPTGFQQPAPDLYPNLYVWTDTCNVYVFKKDDKALLIDLGDGSVLKELPKLGITQVEWILFTDHHREQSQGIEFVDREITKVAAPEDEEELFETPGEFRQWFPKLSDKYTVYGASYSRPPRQPISLDRILAHKEVFEWQGLKLECRLTPGHSPGGLSYLVQKNEKTIAFIGGVMHDGSKMSTWYDIEWDYGFGKGIDVLMSSVENLIEQHIHIACPSVGPVIHHAHKQFLTYLEKLKTFRASYVRGYPVFDSTEEQRDSYSKPTTIPLINQVTPHLYKLSHETKGKNFAIIISDNGRGLILDAGLFSEAMLEEIIVGLRKHMGLKEIDAFWISHMHGDHFLLGPTLKEKYGAEAWTLDIIADKCEHPRNYDYSALVYSYGSGIDGMEIEKSFKNGESVMWEGYKIQVDWMPGQTEFGCCLWLDIDGKRIAFTGDNLFGTASDPQQDGHEAVVARNSAILEEGYLLGSAYLKDLKPDIVMGSHSYVMDNPAAFLQRYHSWSKEMIRLYKEILPGNHYEYKFDPYWVSAYPYRVDLSDEKDQKMTVTVRNFRGVPEKHDIELKLPPGVSAEPSRLTGFVKPESERDYEVTLTVDRTKVPPGVQMATFDITLDDKKHGELFDFLVLGSKRQE